MAIEQVGYRRLYDAIGCSLAERDELSLSFEFQNGIRADVYFGPKPRFGIWVGRSDKYVIPDGMSILSHARYHGDASKSEYPRSFFTEVFCSAEIEVTDELSEAFHNDEQPAREELLQLAEARKDDLHTAADLVAGVIGLRFHRQFVIELINENFLALRDDDHVMRYYGDSLEVLESLSLNETGVAQIENLLPALGAANAEAVQFGGIVLRWLMRAWAERDTVNKFVALFVPLEMVLRGVSASQTELKKRARQLRTLIRAHAGEDRKELLAFVDGLVERQRPTLEERFQILAEEAQLPGWDRDVEAFRHFNSVRNGLLHRGEHDVRLQVSVTEDEVRSLDDMVERYVNFALFRDAAVYRTRWRPPREATAGASS
jgi:hypothetical protein